MYWFLKIWVCSICFYMPLFEVEHTSIMWAACKEVILTLQHTPHATVGSEASEWHLSSGLLQNFDM